MFVIPYAQEPSSETHVSTSTAYNYNVRVTGWVLETALNQSALIWISDAMLALQQDGLQP